LAVSASGFTNYIRCLKLVYNNLDHAVIIEFDGMNGNDDFEAAIAGHRGNNLLE